MHPFCKVQIALLKADKAPTILLLQYSNFIDVFSPELVVELSEYTEINNHTIDLVNDKQLPYEPVYSLGPVELKILKTYIETNLVSGFIRFSKSPASALILFIWKPNSSFRLYVNSQALNNLIIKNRYSLPMINKSPNWLDYAKQYTHLDLTSAYHQMRICKRNKWKTAFCTKYSYFEYQVMPYNSSNISASFQEYNNKILAEKLNVFIIVCLDDILIYTNKADYIDSIW